MRNIHANNTSSICPWYTFGLLEPWPELIRQLMEGLEYLHTRDPPIKHKDLKPDNILLLCLPSHPFVQPIIADFSISKPFTPGARTTDHPYTYMYRTPEQGEGKGTTTKSDVYQLGCCLLLIEGVLCSGREGFRHVYCMAIEETPEELYNSCRFAGNIASIRGFLDAKISEFSHANPSHPLTLFRTKLRVLVRHMVELDPKDRLCISSALRIFKRINEATGAESMELTCLFEKVRGITELVSLIVPAINYWIYHTDSIPGAEEETEEEMCAHLAMCKQISTEQQI
jgi:serine/threonine protein kinase